MNPCELPALVEACTGLATCEDGMGDLAREVCDLAAAIKADPHFELLLKVVEAGEATDRFLNAAKYGKRTERLAVDARQLRLDAVSLAVSVGLEGGDE